MAMLWKMTLFRLGEKKAFKEFIIRRERILSAEVPPASFPLPKPDSCHLMTLSLHRYPHPLPS